MMDGLRAAPAAWLEDPSGSHRWRYWSGARWTGWVADDQQPFLERPPALQRFWAQTLVFGGPIFFLIWGGIVLGALTNGGVPVGVVLGTLWVAVAVRFARQPFVATLRPDGSLTFRSLTRRIETTADAVYRIALTSGGPRGAGGGWVFFFDSRRASLGLLGGNTLCRYLRQWNPGIQGP